MARYANLKDRKTYEILENELEHFKMLIKGHEKLLRAIGRL
mgnify:CR=1 FL=1